MSRRTGFSKDPLPWPRRGLALITLLTIGAALHLGAATLTHRYAFDGDATDSIGGADGLLHGNAFFSNNAVVLDGSNSFVQLPNDLFTNYGSATFEVWYADAPINNLTAQLYNFSGSKGGVRYYLTGQASEYFSSGPPTTNGAVNLPSPVVGGTNHFVWTLDDSGTCQVYVNGRFVKKSSALPVSLIGTPLSNLGSTTNDCIGGAGGLSPTVNFKGNILEFRIYQGAMLPLDAACDAVRGPDQISSDPGAIEAVRALVPTPTGPGAQFVAPVFADFAGLTNVDISTQPDLSWQSDNTNVITFATNGMLKTIALGVANVTATWRGFSNTVAVTVGIPADVELLHRYSFSERTNDWILHDSVGTANGRIFAGPTTAAAGFTGNGELAMHGFPASGGYAALPPWFVSCLSEVSIEAWVTWTPGNAALGYGSGGWQRIFDIGNGIASTGQGQAYFFLTPATDNISFTTSSVLHAAITLSDNVHETPRLNWTNHLPTNVLSHVAVTYSPVRGVMKMYLNGVPIASGPATVPLSGLIDTNCWLGKSLFSSDPYFNGRFNEFRIYSGFLSDLDVAADYVAGPDAVGVDYALHCITGTNSLSITWGPSAAGLTLESSTTIGPGAIWTPVPVTPVFQNGRYQSTIPTVGDGAYFRLHAE
jgi:Concanavalin A-like lectin/glucanases superfamily